MFNISHITQKTMQMMTGLALVQSHTKSVSRPYNLCVTLTVTLITG